jgi:hypothetical protein
MIAFVMTFCALSFGTKVQASSAVAVAINSKGGLGYGYSHDPNITEAEIKGRAIKECLNWGGRNPRIIASTRKLGFGAIVMFLRADNKLDYVVSLGAPTWDVAVNEAKKKAKSLGGRAFKVVRGWNDGVRTNQPIIMQKL